MKLSITNITVFFAIFIIFLVILVHFHQQKKYLIINNFGIGNYEYSDDFKLKINDSVVDHQNEYRSLIPNLIRIYNTFESNFNHVRKTVSLRSSFLEIDFYYKYDKVLVFSQISVRTTNKKYCEN